MHEKSIFGQNPFHVPTKHPKVPFSEINILNPLWFHFGPISLGGFHFGQIQKMTSEMERTPNFKSGTNLSCLKKFQTACVARYTKEP